MRPTCISISLAFLFLCASSISLLIGCTKVQDASYNKPQLVADSSIQGIDNDYIKLVLKDSLCAADYAWINFDKMYISREKDSHKIFLRLFFKQDNANQFILLRFNEEGKLEKGRIASVNIHGKSRSADDVSITVRSLNRTLMTVLTNHKDNSSINSFKETTDEPAGEQVLPDVVVTGYTYNSSFDNYWYLYDGIMGDFDLYNSSYTYGSSAPQSSGNGGPVYPDETIDVTSENADQPGIDVSKYLNCFGSLPDNGSTFKITLCADLPVNSDPNMLFNYNTGDCGHTFLQLTKANGGNIVQQNIGFYPASGWKSIEANGPVASKIVDNAGHEYNASITVVLDAQHFQTTLNEILYEAKSSYDIDNFNCTDFALSVFNLAVPSPLEIPLYHIPGGMEGELSNTPQGLYNELNDLHNNGNYPDGQITIPGIAGFAGASHGACN